MFLFVGGAASSPGYSYLLTRLLLSAVGGWRPRAARLSLLSLPLSFVCAFGIMPTPCAPPPTCFLLASLPPPPREGFHTFVAHTTPHPTQRIP